MHTYDCVHTAAVPMGKSSCSSEASSDAKRSNNSLSTSAILLLSLSTLLITTIGLRPRFRACGCVQSGSQRTKVCFFDACCFAVVIAGFESRLMAILLAETEYCNNGTIHYIHAEPSYFTISLRPRRL